ncbi:MAG: hypothetical protein K8R85_11930 [Bacteroidetes bacterium]|nr:hypothetical protein [Bacteroidota bacterium]
MQRLLFVLLIAITLVACQQPATLSNDEKRIITNEVRQTLYNYYTDIRKSGLAAEFNYLDNSKEFFWVPPGFSGAIFYDSVAAILNKSAKLFTSVNNTFDTLIIVPLRNDLANYTCRLTSAMTLVDGKSSTMSMVETGTLIKRKNGWKLLCGQTTILK